MDRQLIATIQVECQQFLNKVTALTDSAQWEELASCYMEDGLLFRPSDPEKAIEGRSAILASFTARPPRASCHMLANTHCEVVSEDKVIATSRVWLITGENSQVLPVAADSKILVGSFVDTLVRYNDQWLIQCRKGGIELKYNYA